MFYSQSKLMYIDNRNTHFLQYNNGIDVLFSNRVIWLAAHEERFCWAAFWILSISAYASY